MSGALALAASIAALDRGRLSALVRSRRIVAPASVHDPLGLALELLRGESMTRALQMLDREAITALERLGSSDDAHADAATVDRLRDLGLLGLEGERPVALEEVTAALTAALDAADRAHRTDATAPADDPPESIDVSGWYAPALTSVRRAAALLAALVEHPTTLGRRGAATAVSARELAAAVRSDPDTVARLLAVLQAAGLAAPFTLRARYGREQRLLFPTGEVGDWLRLPLHARWIALASATCADIGSVLRQALSASADDLEHAIRAVLPHEFPLLPESDRAAAAEFARTADELGLAVDGRLAPPASLLLQGDAAGAREAAEQGFPPIVDGVYVQPDLSIIVPGPLSPEDEQALSSIAEAEHWGVAVTLRLSHASLQRASRKGFEPSRIRELLDRLSLTGIPQPLDYLLGDLERTGSVSADDEDAAAPAQAGAPEVVADPPAASPAAPDTASAADPLDALVERVFEAARSEPGTGELSRKLELAIRDRSAVRVTAAAGGEERSFTLLPVSLAGGRLRATDAGAGVQRTLPLSAIVAVEAA